jgi:molybdopterin-containing oxidoreductase family membrane subunit
MSKHQGGLLALYHHVDAAAATIRTLKEKGYRDFTVYTPVPNVEIQQAVGHRVSPVRLWTLIGGLTGCASGFALTLWMSYDWPIVVGGKPIGSVIPYVVIAFELTILLGAGATILGLLYHSWRTRQRGAYDGSCTDDRIGIFVSCPVERRSTVEDLLNASGAEEVRVET